MNENKKNKEFRLEELFPIIKHQGREFLCLPTKTEMEMEDGTVYHVNTFYGGSTEMGSLLDALTPSKKSTGRAEVLRQSGAVLWYNGLGFLITIRTAYWEVKNMQENYNAGIYARLSRDDERAGESVLIENQKELLLRHVREQDKSSRRDPVLE